MDLAEAERVINRVLQLHTAEPYDASPGVTVAVCKHCRRPDGGRVVMPCPTTLVVRASRRRP